MTATSDVSRTFVRSLETSTLLTQPYHHWLLEEALPDDVCDAICGLPWTPPSIDDTYGKRETNNASRTHFSATTRAEHGVCDRVAAAFQNPEVVDTIERVCDVDLTGTFLRIEYCQDTDGFWLEPHTDIGVKRFTMLIYLSSEPGSENWGTDVLDENLNLVHSAPYRRGAGVIFVPATNTWHAFHKRPINGVRRSIMLNYVGPEWRSRHELAFPDLPIA